MQALPTGEDESKVAPFSQQHSAHWYAVYTCPRHEKKVANCLESRGIESFLPLYTAMRCWTDRKVAVELPLFPSYLFVHIPIEDRLRVVAAPRVVRLVEFNGRPAPLQDSEIEAIRMAVEMKVDRQPCACLTAGQRVRVRSGPFQGLEGFVVRRKGQSWIVITIQLLMKSVMLALDAADLEAVNRRKT